MDAEKSAKAEFLSLLSRENVKCDKVLVTEKTHGVKISTPLKEVSITLIFEEMSRQFPIIEVISKVSNCLENESDLEFNGEVFWFYYSPVKEDK